MLLRAETQRAQSNLELLVNSLGEEQAEQSMEARYAATPAFVKLDRQPMMPAAYRHFRYHHARNECIRLAACKEKLHKAIQACVLPL